MRVMIVGPIAGGSLPVARATAAAFSGLGLDSVFVDYSPVAHEFYKVKASGSPGQIVDFLNGTQKILLDQVNRSKPDVVFGIAQSPLFNEGVLDDLRKSGVVTTFWFVEDFRIFDYWKSIAPHFDIFFAIQTGPFKQALDEVGAHNHYYLPLAYDGDSDSDDLPVQGWTPSPVAFMGAPYPNRVRVFERLTSCELSIYGEGWDKYAVRGVIVGDRRISESEARWIYKHTQINVNLHSSMDPGKIGGDFVNPRTFELAGLGCFQLSDRRELMPPLYAEDEIVQFGDEAELTELIDYYLKHEAERHEIAKNARKKTLRNHLYEHRVVEIMKAVRNL